MIRHWLAIALLFSVFSTPSLLAQEGNLEFYLLRTGTIVEGTATFDGRHYIVQTQFGTMSLPVQSVEFVGRSRMEIYLYKRSGVDPADFNALVRFAEWCISNGFIAEGIAEYQRAEQIAPNAVFAGIVQRRLETLRQMGTQIETADLAHDLPIPQVPIPQVPTPQVEIPAGPLAEFSVSRQTFESFARRVQPILVNRCIAADCHGTHGDRQFRLGIPQESMGSTARRNLQAVLPYIDRDYPMESPILLALVTPHGGARTALPPESHLYTQAAQWVQQVAQELPSERRAESRIERMLTDPTMADPTMTNTMADTIRVSELPEQFRRAIPQAERLESSARVQPRRFDPLDPDAFNDRYHRLTRDAP